ncbi:hypothetical protein PPYR_14123 [Photinus pyralis]|uniref:Obscurin n=2 Tax=Photinus pyralis TaxID=7054 RepID=A0A5N4A498_PHOPY|nr:hypothetical protein PPYR_14123 [Photinus pyralis]
MAAKGGAADEESKGEVLVAWQSYTASAPDELTVVEGETVELIDTDDPARSAKRLKLDPALDVASGKLLDSTAAKHKLSVKPQRKHFSSRYSPTRSQLNARWLVRQTKGEKKEGRVPCHILQSIDEPVPGTGLPGDAAFRRQAVVKELVETEQEFVKDLDYVVQQYLIRSENAKIPKIIRDNLQLVFGGLVEIADFHRTVLMEGVKYYANEPNLLGKAFLRLERDFDKHVNYYADEPLAQSFLDSCDIARDHFDELSQELDDDKTLSEHLKLPIQRINDYQLLLKELVRYTECLGEDCANLKKALELMLSVPHRAEDDKFISSIEGYKGSIHKLGRLILHNWFTVTFANATKERYLFLFKPRVLISKVRRVSDDRSVFQLKDIIKLTQVDVKDHPDKDTFELIDKVGGHSLKLKAHQEHVKELWLKEIREFTCDIEEQSEDIQLVSEQSTLITETVVEPKPFIPPQASEAQQLLANALKSGLEAKKAEAKTTEKNVEEVASESESMSRRYGGLSSSSRGGEEYDSSYSRRSIKQSYGSDGGSRYESLSSKYGAESTKYGAESISTKYGGESTYSSAGKYSAESIASKYSTDGRHGDSASLSSSYSKRTHSIDSDVGSGLISSTYKARRTISDAGNGDVELSSSSYSRKYRGESSDLDDGLSSYSRKYGTDGGDLDSYSYSKKRVTSIESGDLGGSKYTSKKTLSTTELGEGDGSKYTRKILTSYGDDDFETRESLLSKYSKKGDAEASYERRDSYKRSVSGQGDEDDVLSKYSKYERHLSQNSKKANEPDDEEEARIEAEMRKKYAPSAAQTELETLSANVQTGESIVAEQKSSKVETKVSETTQRAQSEVSSTTSSKLVQKESEAVSTKTTMRETTLVETEGTTASVDASEEGDAVTKFKLNREPSGPMIPPDTKPIYIKMISGSTVEPGQAAVFEVALPVAPDNVAWLKDNKLLSQSNRVRIIKMEKDKVHRLEIAEVEASDAGLYSAVAANPFGKTTCSAQLIVLQLTEQEKAERAETEKPVFLVQLKDTDLLEDTYLRFMVKVKGDPHPTVTFYKDDVKIRESNKRCHVVKDAAERGFYELVIPEVKVEDGGNYKCIASNAYGDAVSEATVTVTDSKKLFEDLPPEALHHPADKPTFLWKKDGKPFTPEERFKVLLDDDEDSLALLFKHVRPDDAGLYTCVAQTSSGHISCSAELTVHGVLNQLAREPEKPQLVMEKREAIVQAGGSAMLELQVKGYPKPNVLWKHDGVPLSPTGKYKFLYEDEETMTLVIKDVQKEDAGVYQASAQNELGSDTVEMTLNVKVPPKIKTKLEDVSVAADIKIEIPVEIEGLPRPSVHFYRDGQEIKTTERVKIIEREEIYTLVIEKGKITDSGSYSVVASNEISEVSKFWNVDVHCEPRLTKKIGGDRVVSQEEEVKLVVEVESRPAPEVTWYKDEVEIKSDEHYVIKKDGDEYMLKITGAVTTDSSRYKFKAKNIYGSVETDCKVDVKRAPTITKRLKDMTVNENEKVELEVTVDAFPKPTYKWFMDEVEIMESRKEFTRIESDDGCKLVIKEVTSSLSGQYKCKVINELGETETSAKLVVNCKPRFIRQLQDTTVDEGSTLHLEVEIEACPEPSVKWLRNGREVNADARIKITRDTQRHETYNLAVNLIKYEEQGEYEVVVTNSLGTVSSKSFVTVQTTPTMLGSTFGDKTQYESLDVCYSMEAMGNPRPSAVWTLDGKILKPDSHFKITNVGNEYKLEIKKLDIKDAGVYECTVSNPMGAVKQQATLTLLPEGELRRPKVVEPLHDQTTVKRSPSKLSAVVTGDPVPEITWCVNGTEITPKQYETFNIVLDSEDREIENGLKECTYSMTIPKSEPENEGTYTSKAKNKWGECECSAQLTIVFRPEIDGPQDVAIVPGNAAEFTVKVRANPAPTVTWHKDGNVVEPGHGLEIVEDAENETYKLVIPNVRMGDEGRYQVRAKNNVGERIAEAKLRTITEKPYFITSITDAQVDDYGEITLMVRADGLPKPEIKWFFNGVPLQEDDRHRIETKADTQVTSSLTITGYHKEDSGQYKAMAVNCAGEAETTAAITLTQTAPAFGKHFDRNEGVDEGEPMELKAKILGSPRPAVSWLKDGEPISPEDSRIKTTLLPDGTAKLNIESAKPSDSGAYKLVVKNPNGEISALCAVAVNPKPQRPKFLKCFKDAKVTAGEPLRLEAKVVAYPPPEIKWMKDGAPVRPSSNIHLEQLPDGSVALSVDSVKPESAGTYTLLASNRLGESENHAQVEIEKKVAKPEFIVRMEPMTVVEGFPAKFEVKAVGFPPPSITWCRNDVEVVSDNKHIKIVEQPDGGSALYIDACDILRDKMAYKAIATNDVGQAESSAILGVTPATKEGVPEEAPALLHPLRDAFAHEGQPLVMEVPFTANPVPHVQWTKDGKPLEASERVLLTCDGKKVALHVDNATPADAGVYSVTLTNALGSDTSEGTAGVHKVFTPPRFTQTFGDLQQIPGRDGKLLGRVSGIPSPEITWFKDGHQIFPSEKYRMKREGDLVTLYIDDCALGDSGLYRAFAVNKEGSDTCEANFDVVDEIKTAVKVEPPSFLKRIGDLELYRGMTAKFTACASGFPEPTVEWFKNDQKLSPSSRVKMEVDRAGLLRLTIEGIKEEDLGRYSCKISNEHGSDICHAHLQLDDLDAKPKRPIGDEYVEYDKFKKGGIPVPLSDPPIISRMTDRHCTLSWKPSIPAYPHVPPTYILEMSEQPQGDWFTARSGIRNCVCTVRNLEPYRDYKFRVRVENKYGVSDPSPYATTHRERIEPDLPKISSYLPHGTPFHPDTSPYFPHDFDIERPSHDNMSQAPRFLRQEHPTQYGYKNHNTNLFWYVYGYPKPKMEYFFEDEPIESGGRFDMSYTRNGQATLFINKMLERDVGWYEAVATNEHGQARQRVRLEIAELPVFITRPDIQYTLLRRQARFEARIIGKPYPEVKWYKDWKPLAESSRVKIRFVEPDLWILTINDVILKDEGLYSVSARNFAGTVSNSAMLYVDESDYDHKLHTYEPTSPIRCKRKLFNELYDLGDELGRGTQGITYHAVDRSTGNNYAAKVMHGSGNVRPFMLNEFDMYNQLRHRRLISMHDAYESDDGVALLLELGGGGELVRDYLLKRDYYTERDIAWYVRQMLEGLEYMHRRGYGHMGLNIGDLLLSHIGGSDLKITDFGLARRIQQGNLYPLLYGMPEYVSPEAVRGEGTGFGQDMWSVGIITYILLSGRSPFLGKDDRETLTKIRDGNWQFDMSWWQNISVEARDFITKLLIYHSDGRMDVHSALKHPWLERADRRIEDEYRISSKYLHDYYLLYKEWYDNASCRRWFRRRPLEGAFTHPSRMVYPPGDIYTPPSTPAPTSKPIPTYRTWEDQLPSRSPLNYEIGLIKSESHYQNGPDTYLLQLRDVDFPVRVREYMKIAANRGPGRSRIISNENGFEWDAPSVRERRRFMDVMDEEIDDERKERINRYGVDSSAYTIRRLRHELGPRLDTYAEAEAMIESKQEGRLPFFREKPQVTAMVEGKDLEMTCLVVGDPKPSVQWFKNDAIVVESARVKIETDSENRTHFKLSPALGFDLGMYRIVARNKVGQTIARTRIVYGTVPDAPDSPEATQISDSEILLTWKPPKSDGNSHVLCYSLEYKLADDAEWTKKADNIDHEFYLMSGLEQDTRYMFRLAAKNAIGWSDQGVASAGISTSRVGASKIRLTTAMQHLQQITDSGQAVEEEGEPRPDYNLETAPVDWTSGSASDHYEVISEIARGKFSAVLKAIDKKNDRVVVAKYFDLGLDSSDNIDGEFAALRSLRHERIAGLLAAYRSSNEATFILEKLQGADVLTYLASKHEYTEQTVATIVSQILDGLQYLHWRNLCHLDLQPDNVVMCGLRSVQIKLVDLGSAHRVTKLGTKVPVVGHPDYISPEVLNEELAFPQSDIWSVGVLTYVMLSGTLPFKGEDEHETRQNISFVRYRFEYLFQELSQEGNRFVMLIFKRHPNKRPSAEECHENRWLLPTDSMIKKRERAVFLGNRLREYSEKYHSEKSHSAQVNKLGKSLIKSHSIQEELLIAP